MKVGGYGYQRNPLDPQDFIVRRGRKHIPLSKNNPRWRNCGRCKKDFLLSFHANRRSKQNPDVCPQCLRKETLKKTIAQRKRGG